MGWANGKEVCQVSTSCSKDTHQVTASFLQPPYTLPPLFPESSASNHLGTKSLIFQSFILVRFKMVVAGNCQLICQPGDVSSIWVHKC